MQKGGFPDILRDVFYILSITLIVFSFMEILSPKFVIPYVNMNLLLIITLISGILLIVKL